MKEDSNIDDLFRSSFEGFEVAPPAAVKTAIDRAIGGKPSRRYLWFLLLVLLLGTGLAFGIYAVSGNSGNAGASTASANSNAASGSGQHLRGGEPGNDNGQTSDATQHHAGSGKRSGSNAAAPNDASGKSTQNTTDGTSAAGKRGASTKSAGSATTRKGASAASQKTPSKKRSGKKRPSGSGNSGLGGLAAIGQDGGSEGQLPGTTTADRDSKTATPSETTPPETPPVTPPVTPVQKTADHSDDTSFDESPSKPPKKPQDDPKLWRASVYAGPQFGMNGPTGTDSKKLSETSAFALSGEINRSLFAGYGLTTGFGYTTPRNETFTINQQTIDSTVVIEEIPIFDPNFPDSIIGYDTVVEVFYDTTGLNSSVTSSIRSLSIPVYLSKSFTFGDKWGILVNAGATFNFYKVKPGTTDPQMPAPQVNDFSVNLLARVHATYSWNRFLFSAGVNTGWDMKPAIRYDAIDRKRYYVTPQVGVHFSF